MPAHKRTRKKIQRTPERQAWLDIRKRCLGNAAAADRRLYKDRGIGVCQRWIDSFDNFLADMGPRPSPKHSIDRIDNDGDYTPENCRWATWKEQANNKRSSGRPQRLVTYAGKTQTLHVWANELSIKVTTLLARIDHLSWPVSRVLSTPRLSYCEAGHLGGTAKKRARASLRAAILDRMEVK